MIPIIINFLRGNFLYIKFINKMFQPQIKICLCYLSRIVDFCAQYDRQNVIIERIKDHNLVFISSDRECCSYEGIFRQGKPEKFEFSFVRAANAKTCWKYFRKHISYSFRYRIVRNSIQEVASNNRYVEDCSIVPARSYES
jgi:hypothetical protein